MSRGVVLALVLLLLTFLVVSLAYTATVGR